MKKQENGGSCTVRSFIFCTHSQILLGRSSGGRDMWHAWEKEVYKVLVGKPERKRPLGRPRLRWEDVIRMGLMEIVWGGGVEWIQLADNRDRWQAAVNAVMNFRVLAPRI
jgi:hypothetical protein